MADTDRNAPRNLTPPTAAAELLRDPLAQDFFATLRVLQASPDTPAFGTALRPGDEAIRFAQEPALTFAPTSISGANWDSEAGRLEVLLRFTGLLGPNGPLPIHITEYIIDRCRHHQDDTLRAFLDIFHHRIYSLFFRAWGLNQPTVDYDREDQRRHSLYFRSLIGLCADGAMGRDSVPDAARLYFSGWLGGLSRSPDGLAAILGDFFQVPVAVENFQGLWLTLPGDSRCKLGVSMSTGTLGSTCFLGERVWLTHLKFRLRFGPLHRLDYENFLPGGKAFQQVCDWVRYYVGEEFLWEAQLVMRRSEVNACQLGVYGRLGWTTWIGCSIPDCDVDDLIVQAS